MVAFREKALGRVPTINFCTFTHILLIPSFILLHRLGLRMNPSTKSQNFSDFDPCDNRHDMVEVVVENNVIPPPPDSQDPCNTQCNTTTEEGKEKQDGRGCGDEMVKWMVKCM